MAYINVDLDEFDTEDLIEELEYRGHDITDKRILKVISEIYHKKRDGKDYSGSVDNLIWYALGRIV